MKKVLKWIGVVLLTPILLFVIFAVLLYLPPVQNWAIKHVAAYASEKTGLDITVAHVNLEFPLKLGVEGVKVLQQNDSLPQVKDTVADIHKTVVDVQFLRGHLLACLQHALGAAQLHVGDLVFDAFSHIFSARRQNA